MRKRMITLIITFLLVLTLCSASTFTVHAASKGTYFLSGKLYYHTISKNKVEVCGTTKDIGTLTIPASVYYNGKKYKVTKIADHVLDESGKEYVVNVDMPRWHFYHYERIDGKAMPAGVKSISKTDITKVVLPSTLTYIGEGAFGYCEKLEQVKFAKKYKKLTIGKNAFYGKALKSLVFPDGTYELKENATGITPEITIPASVKKIASGVVNYRTKKVIIDKKNKKFKMKDGILYSKDEKRLISASAKVAKNVVISDKTVTIGNKAFARTKVQSVTLNSNIQSIPKGAFYRCEKLAWVKETDVVKKIGNSAFYDCRRLKSVGLLPNLEKIEKMAFIWDWRLKLTLNSTISDVHLSAFTKEYYSDVGTIVVSEGNKHFAVENNLLIKIEGDNRIVMAYMGEEAYVVVPEGVTEITGYVGGYDCSEIILPTTLKKLTGDVRADTIVFKGKTPPKFADKYWWRGHYTIVVPKGSYKAYKQAITKAYDDMDGEYYIWDDDNIELIEE
ncbi:MAG: leucine-rich repeat domain-containing protein [Lachnospiraceae bacterium]|nr:leucine-rich repeat domain-containing protein [Lachnospiraceae bacterium]